MTVLRGMEGPPPACPQCGDNSRVSWSHASKGGIDGEGRPQAYLSRVALCRIHGEVPVAVPGKDGPPAG